MKTIVLLCLVAASAFAMDTYDHKAIVSFGLISTQNSNGNPSALLNKLMPFLRNNPIILDRTHQLMLLSAGGLTIEKSMKMLDEVLPELAREGKSSEEQLMALLVASNQFCPKNMANCPAEDEYTLPMVTKSSQRGCSKHYVHTNIEITGQDKCVCDDQDNVLLWISFLDKIQGYGKQGLSADDFRTRIPDQIPVILMMLMSNTQCNGTIRGTGYRCKCSTVTEGNEALLLQYLINSPGAEDILTSTAKAKVQKMAAEPGTRALDISSLLLSQGNINPSYLSLFLNAGSDPQDIIKQLLLSSLGLDSQMTQLILSGGFGNDNDKIAMINFLANMGIVSTNAVPFVLGVDNGIEFYINSLLSQGVIDPLMGQLLLATQSGASQTDIIEFISQALLGGKNNDYLANLGKPFFPNLPKGIYPGSELYFIHLETLGVNTCALHDLRNRFECGYTGISAAECEFLPYCCYNPVFVTDDEVSNMTAGQITSALLVPWCYYNVFFIYYDSFFLTVKKPGQFASPNSCLSLFKYGLNIDASIYYVYAQTAGNSALSGMINARSECGFPGVTEFHCVAIRGCCWDSYAPYRVPQCFDPNGNSAFDFNLNALPVAYQPTVGTCATNYRQLDVLFYTRVACHATFQMIIAGYDPLKNPDKYDCLWKLGCCWEDREEVLKKFPSSPRCYKRVDDTYAARPNNIAQVTDLFARSSGSTWSSQPPPYISNNFPAVGKPNQ